MGWSEQSGGRTGSDRFERLARRAIAAYGLEEARLQELSQATHVVLEVHDESASDESPGHYALRVCPRGWDRSQLTREFLWLGALRREEALAVPEPVLTRSGELFRSVSVPGVSGFRYVALLRWVEGVPVAAEDWTRDHARRLGRLIGRLHRHAAMFSWPAELKASRRDASTVEESVDLDRLSCRLASNRSEVLVGAVERARWSMAALGIGSDVAGVIHANLRPENVVFLEEEARAIGFTRCRWGYYLYDVATATLAVLDREDEASLREELMAGYCESRPLPDLWSEHIDAFVALRLLDIVQRRVSSSPVRAKDELPASVELALAHLRRIVKR
jgi:Ser/Thr protein kinase RdoA (MazF antagonist)